MNLVPCIIIVNISRHFFTRPLYPPRHVLAKSRYRSPQDTNKRLFSRTKSRPFLESDLVSSIRQLIQLGWRWPFCLFANQVSFSVAKIVSTSADTSASPTLQSLCTVVNASNESVMDSRSFGQSFFESHTSKARIVLQPDLCIQRAIILA